MPFPAYFFDDANVYGVYFIIIFLFSLPLSVPIVVCLEHRIRQIRRNNELTLGPSILQATQYIGEICRYLLLSDPCPEEKMHSVRKMFGNGLRPQVKGWSTHLVRRVCCAFTACSLNMRLTNITNSSLSPTDEPLVEGKQNYTCGANESHVSRKEFIDVLSVQEAKPKGKECRFPGFSSIQFCRDAFAHLHSSTYHNTETCKVQKAFISHEKHSRKATRKIWRLDLEIWEREISSNISRTVRFIDFFHFC